MKMKPPAFLRAGNIERIVSTGKAAASLAVVFWCWFTRGSTSDQPLRATLRGWCSRHCPAAIGQSGRTDGTAGEAPGEMTPGTSAPPDLFQPGLDLGDLLGAHLARGRDLAVLDAPQPERAGDVAVLVEGDRADDAFILDRLAVLQQGERLGELVLAGVDDLAAFGNDRRD